MFSVRYHLVFWLLAACSVAARQVYGIYQSTLGQGWDDPLLIVQWTVVALLTHGLYSLLLTPAPASAAKRPPPGSHILRRKRRSR